MISVMCTALGVAFLAVLVVGLGTWHWASRSIHWDPLMRNAGNRAAFFGRVRRARYVLAPTGVLVLGLAFGLAVHECGT